MRAQTETDYEHLIYDGASTDNTLQLISAFVGMDAHNRGPTFVTSEPDTGIYNAMNKGLAAAQGRYIAFLNADDWYEPDTLATAKQLLTETRADNLAGATRVHNLDGTSTIRPPRPELTHQTYPRALPTVHQSWFARTDLLRQAGGFNEHYNIAADYDLYLRIQTHHPTWTFTTKPLSNFTLGGASYALLPTAREYRDAKIANGQPPLLAYITYYRNILAASLARYSLQTKAKYPSPLEGS
jgi:glycosyltransferase involved in cell wall biosynthesis